MTSYTILVVDDDPAFRDVLRGYLELASYQVKTAQDGLQALEFMQKTVPDLVLLDVQMPELDGFSTLKRMREEPSLRHIPVMMLSSLEAVHIKVRGLELGAEDYIVKHSSSAELLARIRAGLRRTVRYQKYHATLSGELGPDFALDTLLQTIQIAMKTARIRLPDVPAEIFCSLGAIHSCSYRTLQGAAALQRIFLRPTGRFVVELGVPFEQGHSSSMIDSAGLFEAMIAVDEALHVLNRLARQEALVDIDIERATPAFSSQRAFFPFPLIELLALYPGDIRSAVDDVVKAIQDGGLKLVA